MSQNNPYADTDPTSNPLPDPTPAADPAATPAAGPASQPSPAAQSALDEIARLEGVVSDLQTRIADPKLQGISGKAQRDKLQQQISQATQELAIAHRKYTDILAGEGRTQAGTTRTGSVQTITRPEGTYTKDGPPDASGKPTWRIATDAQGNPLPGSATRATPTATANLDLINDPNTGKPIAYRDPATGTTINLPAGVKPERPTIVNGQNGAMYSWDGTSLTSLVQGKPDKPQIVQGQNGAVYTWDGQQLNTVLPPTKTQPKEGDTRPNVDKNGYRIQERFQGGDWVTDPSVAPTPFTPEAASKPTEGATRRNVQGGYAVTERYSGGQWVIDPDVAPVRYTPQPPTTVQTGTADQFIVQQDPQTGEVKQIPNPNYQPAAADIAGRVQQLQQQAKVQRDKLQQDVLNGTKTAEQAAQEFDQYWSSSVDPYVKQAQQAQDQAKFENQVKAQTEQRQQEEQERSIYTTAQTAGQNAVSNQLNQMKYQVGPGYGDALKAVAAGKGVMPANFDLGSAFTFQGPNLNDLAHQATAEALAHISPTAAAAAGRPMPQVPQGMDVGSMLNRSNYQIAAPTTTIAPDGTVTIQHTGGGQPQPSAVPDMPTGTVYPQGDMGGVDPQTGMTYTAPPFQGTGQQFTGEVDPSQLD